MNDTSGNCAQPGWTIFQENDLPTFLAAKKSNHTFVIIAPASTKSQ